MDPSIISPELALVDPELAEAARKLLPARQQASPASSVALPIAAHAHGTRARSLLRRSLRAASLLAAAVALGYAAAWVLLMRTDGTAEPAVPSTQLTAAAQTSLPSLSTRTTSPAPSVQTPRVAPRTTAVRLIWRPVTAAAYYDVILWRGHTRVLDIWPAKPSVNVPGTWQRGGARGTLLPGRYRWFVYPGFGPRSAHRFGPLAASGTFVVGKP